jgi:hypothetical protein
VLNLYRNCFKHLGETEEERAEDQRTLDQFHDRVNGFLLYVAALTSPLPDGAGATIAKPSDAGRI